MIRHVPDQEKWTTMTDQPFEPITVYSFVAIGGETVLEALDRLGVDYTSTLFHNQPVFDESNQPVVNPDTGEQMRANMVFIDTIDERPAPDEAAGKLGLIYTIDGEMTLGQDAPVNANRPPLGAVVEFQLVKWG